jgi:hypothetical protein
MSPRAEAEAGPAAHGLLHALDQRSDLRTVRQLRDRIEGRPDAVKRVSHGLPDPPADLCQGVGELGVPVIAHARIISLTGTQSQGTFTHLRHVSGTMRLAVVRGENPGPETRQVLWRRARLPWV